MQSSNNAALGPPEAHAHRQKYSPHERRLSPPDIEDKSYRNDPRSPPRYVPVSNPPAPSESTNSTFPKLSDESIRRANASHFQLNSAIQNGQLHDGPGSSLNGLHIQTNLPLPTPPIVEHVVEEDGLPRRSLSINSVHKHTLSHRNGLYAGGRSASPGSAISSPLLAAMGDVTPLPSPIGGNKDPWKAALRSRSRASSAASTQGSWTGSPPRRKVYNGLRQATDPTSSETKGMVKDERQSRSVSEYVPPALVIPNPRPVAVSGSTPMLNASPRSALHREEFLAEQRGLAPPSTRDVSPQPSTRDGYTSEEEDLEPIVKRQKVEVYSATSIATGNPRKYRAIRFLGQGTFSRVFLAVRLVDWKDDDIDYSVEGTDLEGVKLRSKRLVAVKVVTHGPAGGADEERIEMSLKREVDLLKNINHPSLVHLRAFGSQTQRSLLVLNFCPGGDLFELASTKLDILVPSLVRRIFAELVSAVHYLHKNWIVHRDIKLENVLLNIPVNFVTHVHDWQSFDRATVTITDFGLSRRIPPPPESPLLSTRCGSEDYAAPEILMGQPYDGRQTDAWALGVMLYALMEGRLPFDPLPGTRGDPARLRARTPHRIARCEWAWYKFGDNDGDWDEGKAEGFEGAQLCVDALLKRTSRRKDLAFIEQIAWVKDAISVEGGLNRDEDHL